MVQTVQISTLNVYNETDFEQTKNLLLESYSQYNLSFETREIFDEYFNSIRESLHNEAIEKIFIVKDSDQIVGTLQLFSDGQKAYKREDFNVNAPFIRFLAVSPLVRKKGIARFLIDGVVSYLKEQGYDSVYLHTSHFMVDAIKLYERYGFVRHTPYDFYNNERLIQCYKYDIK